MKKSYKSFLALGLSLGLIGLVSACGKSDEANSKTGGKVKLAINLYTGAISDESIKSAKEKFPDYELTFNTLPADQNFDKKLKTSLNSKSAPDITTINSNIEEFLPYSEKFVNLLDYDVAELESDYVDWKWGSAMTPDKKNLIAMPLDIGPTALFYHVETFEKAGLPTDPKEVSEKIKTDEDYMNAAKQIKEKADKATWLSGEELLAIQLRKMTKSQYDEEGKLILADGQTKEAWDFTVEAIKNGYTLGVQGNSVDSMVALTDAMYTANVSASWGVQDMKDDYDKRVGQWRIAKAPGNASNYGGSYLAVIGTTDHPKEAAEVVKFLTGPEMQKTNMKELSLFPANQKVYEDDVMVNEDEFFGGQEINQYFIDAAKNINYVYKDTRNMAAEDALIEQISLVEYQDKDPETAWKDAVSKIEKL